MIKHINISLSCESQHVWPHIFREIKLYRILWAKSRCILVNTKLCLNSSRNWLRICGFRWDRLKEHDNIVYHTYFYGLFQSNKVCVPANSKNLSILMYMVVFLQFSWIEEQTSHENASLLVPLIELCKIMSREACCMKKFKELLPYSHEHVICGYTNLMIFPHLSFFFFKISEEHKDSLLSGLNLPAPPTSTGSFSTW